MCVYVQLVRVYKQFIYVCKCVYTNIVKILHNAYVYVACSSTYLCARIQTLHMTRRIRIQNIPLSYKTCLDLFVYVK